MTPNIVESGKKYQPVNEVAPQDQVTPPRHDVYKRKAFGRECTTNSSTDPSASPSPEQSGKICPRVHLDPAPSLFARCPKAIKIPVNALCYGVFSGLMTGVFTMAIAGFSMVVGKPFGYEGINLAASYPLDPLDVGFKAGALAGALSSAIVEMADLDASYFHQAFRDTYFTHVVRVMTYGSLGAFALGYPIVASCALGVAVGMVYGSKNAR